jgi:hypothetical protein
MDIHINYLVVFVAGLANMVLGALWYSPLMFGKVWMKLMGLDKLSKAEKAKMMERAKPGYAFAFLAALLMSFVMAHMVQSGAIFYHVAGVEAGLLTGFLIWVGFILTSQINSVLWEGKPVKLYWINTAHYLAAYLITGVILAVWP